jgi:hypothetical protein
MIERRKSEASGLALSDGELLRRDAKGRVWTPGLRRAALLAQFDRSGLSGAEFAKLTGIKYPTFAGWLHQRRKAGQRPSVQWMEAAVTAPATAVPALRVDLPGGAWMELRAEQMPAAAALLRELVRGTVEGGGPC